MKEAVAHMKQLMLLGAGYVQAVIDTVNAYDVDQFELQAEYHKSPIDYRLIWVYNTLINTHVGYIYDALETNATA